MTLLLGSKQRFALELGEERGGSRRVDAWAADQWLTCDDNMAYIPQLRRILGDDLAKVASVRDSPFPFPELLPVAAHRRLLADENGLRERWWYLMWGETTDNVLAHLLPYSDRLVLTVEFWRGEHLHLHPEHAGVVFAAEIAADELLGILQEAIDAFNRG